MSRSAPSRGRVSPPWAFAALAMVLFIWGNSLVPGTESAGLSLAVVEAVQGALDALGIPSGWVSNFLVRKTAHFCEYALLGFLMAQALDPGRTPSLRVLVPLALVLVLVPSLDETIQLFVEGRSGRLADVLLDCCGAATAVLVRGLVVWREPGERT